MCLLIHVNIDLYKLITYVVIKFMVFHERLAKS